MLRRGSVVVLMIAHLVCFCAGCWDIEEINRRAAPGAIALDATGSGMVRVVGAFPIPGTQLPPYGSAEQQLQKRHFVVDVKGRGVLDAWKELQAKSMRTIDFTQLQVVIFTEEYLRRGELGDLFDFVDRTVFISGNALCFLCKGDPRRILDTDLNNKVLPSTYLRLASQSAYKRTLLLAAPLWRVSSLQINGISDIYLPIIEATEGQYMVTGTALFSKERHVGELDIDETQLLSFLRGVENGYLTIPLSADAKSLVAFSEVGVKTQISPIIRKNGSVRLAITMNLHGNLREIRPRKLNFRLQDIDNISRVTESTIKRRLAALLEKCRSLNADPVGFGSKVRAKDPSFIEKHEWHTVFPKATFDVKIKFNVVNTGVRK